MHRSHVFNIDVHMLEHDHRDMQPSVSEGKVKLLSEVKMVAVGATKRLRVKSC